MDYTDRRYRNITGIAAISEFFLIFDIICFYRHIKLGKRVIHPRK